MDVKNVINALDYYDKYQDSKVTNSVNDYDVDDVSKVVLKTILSYTDHVNMYSWRKEK